MNARITLVESISPPIVAKRFSFADGVLKKESVANIFEGKAWSKAADDAESFAAILRQCAERSNCCLIPGSFASDDAPGKTFALVTEKALAQALKKNIGDAALAGLHEVGRERWAARLKRSISLSVWLLLDADDPEGMPEEMRRLDLCQRLAAFEALLPGISRAERVVSRSSSFRVRHMDETPRRHGHAWLRVSDPTKIEMLRLHFTMAAVNAGLAFRSPRRDRTTGAIIGHAWRTLFDQSVLVPGRLVFGAKPFLDDSAVAAGYVLDDAGIEIVNAGAGTVDLDDIDLPSRAMIAEYDKRTGTHSTITRRAGSASLGIHVRGVLTPATSIESRGVTKSLSDWLAAMPAEGGRMRCETPFRASASEAAFIVKHADGSARIHDIGTGETHSWAGPHRHEEGTPSERVVIGTDRLAMIEAVMRRGMSWMIRLDKPSLLAGLWIDDNVREVVIVSSPDLVVEDIHDIAARLRVARKRVVIVPPARLRPPDD